jgi:hypothetical protein
MNSSFLGTPVSFLPRFSMARNYGILWLGSKECFLIVILNKTVISFKFIIKAGYDFKIILATPAPLTP